MSYLSTIYERELLREIERYKDACLFYVDPGPHAYLSQITVTLRDTKFTLPYSAYNFTKISEFYSAIQSGPEGVYVWPMTAYGASSSERHTPTRGKWVDVRDLHTHRVIAILPWCREFRDAVVSAIETMRDFL